MACNEGIVLALVRIGERRQTFELPIGMKTIPTTGENLMGICLMTHIPNQFVFRGVENIMQRHGQLDSTKRGTQMARILTQRIDDELAQLRTNSRQFLHFQFLQVRRRINPIDILVIHDLAPIKAK